MGEGVLIMTNILLVEDNNELRKLLKIHLGRAGYQVYEAVNGVQALEVMEHTRIHLIVADIMMPLMDGYELTSELRNAGFSLPILMLTAKDTLADKRRGFHSGADDYMTKPVDIEEMLLRIEALLRRCNLRQETMLQVGDCTLNAETLQVTGKNGVIELRQKEFLLLQKLLSYPMKIFTRQALMDEIWGYDSESDPRTVDTHIKRLREKLAGVDSFEIQTVRGLGYKAVIRT